MYIDENKNINTYKLLNTQDINYKKEETVEYSIFDNKYSDEDNNTQYSILDDISNTNYNDVLDGRNLTTIEPTEKTNGFFHKRKEYTYTTKDGVTITVNNPDNVQIYEDKDTGEIIVIGAKDAEIRSRSKDAHISIYDSSVKELSTAKGNDKIAIYNSEVASIDTGKGNDNVTIKDSKVGNLITGSGDDFLSLLNSEFEEIESSSNFLWGIGDKGEDTVFVNDIKSKSIKTGNGNDKIVAKNSNVGLIETGKGQNNISSDNTDISSLEPNENNVIIKDNNYFNYDKSKLDKIDTDLVLKLEDGTEISFKEYTDLIINQDIKFATEEEAQKYTIDFLQSNLDGMKTMFSQQNEKDGFIAQGYNGLKELTGLGLTDKDIEKLIKEQEEMINALTKAMNGEGSMSFEEAYEFYTGTSYSKENIERFKEASNLYAIVSMGCQNDPDYAKKFEEQTGLSVESIFNEFALCKLETFGKSETLTNLTNKYAQDQNSFADKLSSFMSVTGMSCIVVGAILSCTGVGASIGVPLMTLGKHMSFAGMLVDNGIDLIDDATDKNGLTEDEIKNLGMETGVELISYGLGRFIGAGTNLINSGVTSKAIQQGVSKTGAVILGQAAETTADTALSLGADYIMAQGQSLITTGSFIDSDEYWSLDRFLGEGKNQLIGILTGVASSKANGYQQTTIKTAQDLILKGDSDAAKIYMKKRGMKIDSNSFGDFEIEVKKQNLVEQIKNGEMGEAVKNNIETFEKNPDLISKLVDESNQPYAQQMKYNKQEILEAMAIDAAFTDKLINCLEHNSINSKDYGSNPKSKYSGKEILELIELHNENPALIEKMIDSQMVVNGTIIDRFSFEDIKEISAEYKNNPEFFDKLIDAEREITDSYEKPYIPFTDNPAEFIDITKAIQENKAAYKGSQIISYYREHQQGLIDNNDVSSPIAKKQNSGFETEQEVELGKQNTTQINDENTTKIQPPKVTNGGNETLQPKTIVEAEIEKQQQKKEISIEKVNLDPKLSDTEAKQMLEEEILGNIANNANIKKKLDEFDLETTKRIRELQLNGIELRFNNRELGFLKELGSLSDTEYKQVMEFSKEYNVNFVNILHRLSKNPLQMEQAKQLIDLGVDPNRSTILDKDLSSTEYQNMITLIKKGINPNDIRKEYLSNQNVKIIEEFADIDFTNIHKIMELANESPEVIAKAKLLAKCNVPGTDLKKAKLGDVEFKQELEKLQTISSRLHFKDNDFVKEELPKITQEEINTIREKLIKSGMTISKEDANDIEALGYKWLDKYISGSDPLSSEEVNKLIPYILKKFKGNSEPHEPRTRWIYLNTSAILKGKSDIMDLEDFIEQFPDVGETYIANRIQSFAKHPYGAETSYGNNFSDSNQDKNVKFVVYPKNSNSNCYDIGEGKYGSDEVVYLPNQEYVVIYKGTEHVEGHDIYTIYLQEK